MHVLIQPFFSNEALVNKDKNQGLIIWFAEPKVNGL
jgi:hypothetical protein